MKQHQQRLTPDAYLMISAKKLSLQLTPLLDLLLIVIFAQYLEMEQQSVTRDQTQTREQAQMDYEIDNLKQKLAFSESVLEKIQQKRLDLEQMAFSLSESNRKTKLQAEVDQQEFETRLKDLQNQRNKIIAAIQDAFGDSSVELDAILDKMASSAATSPRLPPEQIETLAKKLTETEAFELVTFLMAYEEIRKRCDIWEIHLDEQGVANIFVNQKKYHVRIKSQEDFRDQLYDIYKSLPQPKGLVIVLISYEEVARSLREALLESIPEVTAKMREDSNGRSRFEYAVIGYLPKTDKKSQPEIKANPSQQ